MIRLLLLFTHCLGRKRTDDRFQNLIAAAIRVFLAQGYRRAQMADVAQAMGVAKGTVYLYVESKEALFDLALRCADAFSVEEPSLGAVLLPAELPVPTPDPYQTLRFVKEDLIEDDPVPLLTEAIQHSPGFPMDQVQSEFAAILRQLYAKLNHRRVSMKLIDRCAHDYPELAAVFFEAGRTKVMRSLTHYLELRIAHGYFQPVPDVGITARVILETLTYWAIHRYWDPSPEPMNDQTVEETVIHLLMQALLPGEPP